MTINFYLRDNISVDFYFLTTSCIGSEWQDETPSVFRYGEMLIFLVMFGLDIYKLV